MATVATNEILALLEGERGEAISARFWEVATPPKEPEQ